jgi:hypothetical protein
MANGDRLTIRIKDFGRKVVIEAKRGKIILDKSKQKATIKYIDDENRNKELKQD